MHGSPATVRAAAEVLGEVVEATIEAVEGGSALRKSLQTSSEKSTVLLIDEGTEPKEGESDRDVFAETSGAETDSGAVDQEGQKRADPEDDDEGFYMPPGQTRASQEKGGETAATDTELRAPDVSEEAEAPRDVDVAQENDEPEEDPLGSLGSGFPEEE